MFSGGENDPVLRIGFRRRVDSVPQVTDNVGVIEVAALEGDQHLVFYFGHKVHAAALTGQGNSDGGPAAFLIVGKATKFQFDPALTLRIVEAFDNAGNDSRNSIHCLVAEPSSSRRALNFVR